MQNNTLAAVDIAKEIFEVGVSDRPGRVALRKRLPRDRLPRVLRPAASARPW